MIVNLTGDTFCEHKLCVTPYGALYVFILHSVSLGQSVPLKLGLPCRKLKKDKVATVAFSESFGESGQPATLHYYLASAFEQIYVPEDGHVSLPGIHDAAAIDYDTNQKD